MSDAGTGQGEGIQAGTTGVKEPSGTAVDGSAVYIPLLQRCRASIACQAARFPQADLPPIKAQLGVRLAASVLLFLLQLQLQLRLLLLLACPWHMPCSHVRMGSCSGKVFTGCPVL